MFLISGIKFVSNDVYYKYNSNTICALRPPRFANV